jgi:hypothetical protein
VWNNTLSKLWQRTTTYLPRRLAFLSNRTQSRLLQLVRFNYVKVAEYQRRGLVLHVLIRLDRAMPKYRAHELHPPTGSFTTELLERAVRATIETVDAPVGDELGGGRIPWGSEFDIRRVEDGQARGEIAGDLAKYATKSTELAGGVLHRVTKQHFKACDRTIRRWRSLGMPSRLFGGLRRYRISECEAWHAREGDAA